ncbi:MAG: NUDIX hydrolase [Patescibacteria group bacterium]|jgi:8-oxo-dGTP diphosphatase|nr:NUDIX hydrolase [Patescibacteria group bacterium]
MITKHIVKVILKDSSGKILILRRSKTAPRRPLTWDLPGGFIDSGESKIESAKRELQEETGVIPDEIHEYYSYNDIREQDTIFRSFFVAKSSKPVIKLSYEHDDYMFIPITDYAVYIKYEPLLIGIKKLIS